MKCMRLLILSALFLVSCQTLPAIKSPVPQAESKALTCPSPFLKEPYRLVHAIEVRLGGDTKSAILGVTVADPVDRFISCAIMTAEGLVLFEAQANPVLKIVRALPPFDSADFARNMIDDIKLIFFAPEGELQQIGTLADGSTICRWRGEGGYWVDVIARQPEGIEINKYSVYGGLKRRIKLNRTEDNVYSSIELTANEFFNYSLIMTLIEAVPMEGEMKNEKSKGAEE
jgi:hypothetical protein